MDRLYPEGKKMLKLMCGYTLKTLFRKRKFTVASLISIVLFIVSIVSVFIAGVSVWQSYESYLSKTYGSYTGVVQITNSAMLEGIKQSPDVENSSVIFDYGTLQMPEQAFDALFNVGYMEDSVISSANIQLQKGRLPLNAGEVLIEEGVLQKLGGNAVIDGNFAFGVAVGEKTVAITKKIVGVVSNYSVIQSMRDKTASLWPSVIMTHQDDKLTPTEAYAVVRIKNNNIEILQNFSQQYSAQAYVSPQFSDESFVGSVGGSTQAILIIGMSAVFIIALICLSSFSSLSSSVVEEQIQSLKFIGASSSAMLLFGVLNLLMLYLIALPIGFLGGIACGYGISTYIVTGFVDFYTFRVSLFGVIIGIFTALLLLLLFRIIKILKIKNKKPLADSKQKNFYLKTGGNLKNGSLFFKWSVASLRKNKRAYFGIALSMTVCYFILFMGGMYTQTIAKEYNVDFKDHYALKYMDGEFFSSLFIPAKPYAGIAEGDIGNIINNGEIADFSHIKQLPILIDISRNDLADCDINLQNTRETSGLIADEYEAELREYGIKPFGELYTGVLNACDSDLLSKLSDSKKEKPADFSSFDKEREVIVVQRGDVCAPFKVGENVRLLQVIAKDGVNTKPADRKLIELNLTVSSIVKIEESDYLYDKFSGSALTFACSDSVLKEAGLNTNYNCLYFNLKNPAEYSKTQEGISYLRHLYPEMSVSSERVNEAEKLRLLHTLHLIVIVLTMFIFIVCLFNIINILSMKYLNDKKLWGTLRAMGISRTCVVMHHFGEMLAVMLVSVMLSACFLEIASQRIRSDVTVFNSFLLAGYIVCPLLVCLFTLPVVLSVFRQSIIKQIEYVG